MSCTKNWSDEGLDQPDDKDLIPFRSQVEQAVKTLKKGKSSGYDYVPAEMVLAGGEAALVLIHELRVKIWQT